MATMLGESRGTNQEIKGRVNPSDKHRQDETSTCGSDDEIRRYAKLILAKVKKLKVDLASLSLKCSEPASGSTSGEMGAAVHLEAGEEENAGGGLVRGHENGNDGLSRFKKEMEEDCGRFQSELVSLHELAVILADHVKKPGSVPMSSTWAPSSSSSMSESPKPKYPKSKELMRSPAIAKVTPGHSTQSLPTNDSTAQIVEQGCDPMNLEQVPQSISAIASASSSSHTFPEAEAGNNVQPQTSTNTSTLLQTKITGHAREITRRTQMTRGCKLECIFCQRKFAFMNRLERTPIPMSFPFNLLQIIPTHAHFTTTRTNSPETD